MGYTPNVNLTYNQGAGTFIKEEIVTNVSETQYFGKVNSDKTRTYIKQVWKWGNTAIKGVPVYNWIFERWDYLDNTTVKKLGLDIAFQTTLNTNVVAQITGTGANYEAIQYAPDTLSYKEKCQWYEVKIFGAIKTLTDLALKLGEDPEKVERAFVEATGKLTIVATTINPLAGAIAGAVNAVFVILDAFDVFSSSGKEEYARAKTQYGQLDLILTRWMEEYSRTVQKWQQIDDIEFSNYVAKLKAITSATTTNTGTNMSVFASLQSFVSDNLWVTAIIILLVVIVVTQYRKNKKGKLK